MSNMKPESQNASLETALRVKDAKVADLESLISELQGNASVLDRQIKAEETRTKIEDPIHPAYSNFAKSALRRRDNLRASAAVLKVKLEEAIRERDDALAELSR
jgi:flagellar FliJ protein